MSGDRVGYQWPALAQQAFMAGTCRAGQSIVSTSVRRICGGRWTDTREGLDAADSPNGAPCPPATAVAARFARIRPSQVSPVSPASSQIQLLTIWRRTGPGAVIVYAETEEACSRRS